MTFFSQYNKTSLVHQEISSFREFRELMRNLNLGVDMEAGEGSSTAGSQIMLSISMSFFMMLMRCCRSFTLLYIN